MNQTSIPLNWIWISPWTEQDNAAPRVVYFRKAFSIASVPAHFGIRISADSRYKLYINGAFVQEGPSKGNLETWYADTADLAPFLHTGENVAAVEVLRYPADLAQRNHSLLRTETPCLYVEDCLPDKTDSVNATPDEADSTDAPPASGSSSVPVSACAPCNSAPGTSAAGAVCAPAASLPSLSGSSGWKCRLNTGISFTGEPFRPAPLHILENDRGDETLNGWKLPGFQDFGWADAVPYPVMYWLTRIAESPFHLEDRTIPPLRHRNRSFAGTVCIREASHIGADSSTQAPGGGECGSRQTPDGEEGGSLQVSCTEADGSSLSPWDSFLAGNCPVTIPAHSRHVVEFDAGNLTSGYLLLALGGGKGSRVAIRTSECYAAETAPLPDGTLPPPKKGDRTDWENGVLQGMDDHYSPAGYGTNEQPEEWEPYWFRTFRYVRLTVEASDAPLTLYRLSFRETGYPLDVKTHVVPSDESLAAVWDISERTLRQCMQETYFDCPFYEQLQYAMDARSEILYTYAIAADDRLARKTMEDFRLTQRSDGMINSCAPSVRTNVIPGFSIYYVLMVHDHMMYFGDQALVRRHLPAIDGILNFFDRSLTEKGLVGKVGGPHFRHKYWSFIDWTPQWNSTSGVPLATLSGDGSITMESLLYLMGLTKAAELADFTERPGIAEEYRNRAAALKQAILTHCMGEPLATEEHCSVGALYDKAEHCFMGTVSGADGHKTTGGDPDTGSHADSLPDTKGQGTTLRLVQDGPGLNQYSVHCQVFVILNGLVTPSEGKRMLAAALGDPEHIAQCSVAMQFYLFRALEEVGWYEKTDDLWDLWRKMVADHMTTCVENDTDARSDCHGWAATILYELPSASLGVRPAAPGYEAVSIRPAMGYLTSCAGDVATPRGAIHAEWEKTEKGTCRLTYQVPDGMRVLS